MLCTWLPIKSWRWESCQAYLTVHTKFEYLNNSKKMLTVGFSFSTNYDRHKSWPSLASNNALFFLCVCVCEVFYVVLTLSIPSFFQLPSHLRNQTPPVFILNLWVAIYFTWWPKRGNKSLLCSIHQRMLPKPAQVLTGVTARSHAPPQRLLLDDKQEFSWGGWL